METFFVFIMYLSISEIGSFQNKKKYANDNKV